MKKLILLSAIGLTGCGLLVAELSAQLSTQLVTADTRADAIIAELHEHVRAHPDDAATLARLGGMLQNQGRFEEGEKLLQRAIALDATLTLHGEGYDESLRLGTTGADVYVCQIPGVHHWTSGVFGADPVNGFHAFSIGTTSANGGDEILGWNNSTQNYPVIGQNLYRYHDGRLELIAISWLKHGFCALQQSQCGPCTPAGSGCPTQLGPGCSDPYSASLNGQQNRLGPRSEVNPVTGFRVLNHATPTASPDDPNNRLGGRIRAHEDTLSTPGAIFLVEGQYIHPQDINSGNQYDNASWRLVDINQSNYAMTAFGSTRQRQTAIHAWQEFDSSVVIHDVDVPDDGRFSVAYVVRDNGDGTWRYEYAVHNYNSDRSAGSFEVPLGVGGNVTNMGFSGVEYFNGDGVGGVNYDSTPWTMTAGGGVVRWETESFDDNDNANAIRWGTMYNFWFDSNLPPVDADATIGLFKPGAPDSADAPVKAPAANNCPWDLTGNGSVGSADLASLLSDWGNPYGSSQLADLLSNWGPCPN